LCRGDGRRKNPERWSVTPDVVAGLVLALASGRADALSGRLFSVGEDVDEIVRRAEQVRADELYLLRLRKL
jgi:hypothetical protein